MEGCWRGIEGDRSGRSIDGMGDSVREVWKGWCEMYGRSGRGIKLGERGIEWVSDAWKGIQGILIK